MLLQVNYDAFSDSLSKKYFSLACVYVAAFYLLRCKVVFQVCYLAFLCFIQDVLLLACCLLSMMKCWLYCALFCFIRACLFDCRSIGHHSIEVSICGDTKKERPS